jgi:hypothetical protein
LLSVLAIFGRAKHRHYKKDSKCNIYDGKYFDFLVTVEPAPEKRMKLFGTFKL